MAWALNATNPAPWTGCYPAALDTVALEHGWQLYTYQNIGSAVNARPAWDIEVDVDLFRSPTATLKAKLVRSGLLFVGSWVRLDTSWKVAGTWRAGTLFWGQITRITAHRPHGGGPANETHIEIEARSAEVVFDFPSNATHGISNSYTRCDETQLANVTWKPLGIGWYSHDLNTPTSAQLAAYRAMEVQPGDNIDTFIHAMAEALGQRALGDYRCLGGRQAGYRICPREPDTYTTLNLAGLVTDWTNTIDIDTAPTAIDVTAQWVSGGDQKQARRTYGGPGGLYTRAKAVTIPMRPTGGSLSASDPTAQAYIESIALWPYRQSFTCRAVWWLDVLMQVDSGDGLSRVVAITWQVDTATMTVITANP